MDDATPEDLGSRQAPKVTSQGAYIPCGFSAKQWPPSATEIDRGDTDHWYVLLEPESVQGSPMADLIISLVPRDDSYQNVTSLARLLDTKVVGLNVTVLRRPDTAHN